MPAIHAGMTKLSIFMFCGERKLMKHFVVLLQLAAAEFSFGPPVFCDKNEACVKSVKRLKSGAFRSPFLSFTVGSLIREYFGDRRFRISNFTSISYQKVSGQL